MARHRLEEFTELPDFELDRASIQLLPRKLCTRFQVVVLGKVDPRSHDPVTVGMQNHHNLDLITNVTKALGRKIKPVRLNVYEIERALNFGFYHNVEHQSADMTIVLGKVQADPNNPSSLVDDIIYNALELRATDIHIECFRDDIDLRFRIDGIMHQVFTEISPKNVSGVISRLKILAKMDITEKRLPQDGRFRVLAKAQSNSTTVDFRLNITPGIHGEDAVIRVLGNAEGLMNLPQLGLPPRIMDSFCDMLSNPEGMVFVTGPTGSGKTTTLYASLQQLNDGTRKIVTAEDPIEYELAKICQKQVTSIMSYADLARAFLRQDPDVMLIGEVRDDETADAISRAASTGHLALSTLHTTDSFGTVVRLQTLGLSRELISNTLLGALGQRLLRRVCRNCKEPHTLSEKEKRLLGDFAPAESYHGKGCKVCHGTGYKGRIGVYELFTVDHNVQDMLSDKASMHELRSYAHGKGFSSLLHDALRKANDGLVSIEEVFRTLPLRYINEIVKQ